MWRFYRGSSLCLVHLNDVGGTHGDDAEISDEPVDLTDEIKDQFVKSSWWTRGWTLQELLAPRIVVFLDRSWQILGSKNAEPMNHLTVRTLPPCRNLCDTVERITQIPQRILECLDPPGSCSVAQRMSWASLRRTTRPEDGAYSLLGLFQINLPLIYGEGKRAFERLQLEIIKTSRDQSIFAWADASYWGSSILARSLPAFKNSWDVVRRPSGITPYTMTNHGLEIRTRYKILRWTDPMTGRSEKTYLVPMGFFPKSIEEVSETMVCYFMLAQLECKHYGRILVDHFVWGRQQRGYTDGTLYIHTAKCEDKNAAEDLQTQDSFWYGAPGRRFLAKKQITITRRGQRYRKPLLPQPETSSLTSIPRRILDGISSLYIRTRKGTL